MYTRVLIGKSEGINKQVNFIQIELLKFVDFFIEIFLVL